jgi:hypothetical protein
MRSPIFESRYSTRYAVLKLYLFDGITNQYGTIRGNRLEARRFHYWIIIIINIIMRILVAPLLLLLSLQQASSDLVLTKKIMSLAATSAKLSSLAYQEDPPSEGFDSFGFYDE